MSQDPFEASFDDLIERLPCPIRINESDSDVVADCVIAVAGFESRCVDATSSIVAKNWTSRTAISVVYTNAEMTAPNSQYRQDVEKNLRSLAGGRAPHVIDHDDHRLSSDFGDTLTKALAANGVDVTSEATHIVFDISVGSSRILLEGLHALLGTRARVTLLYTESLVYRPEFEEYRQLLEQDRVRHVDIPEFQTLGVDKVELLKRIPGQSTDARPTFLVVFPSFSNIRASALLSEISPSRVQWVFGVPHLVQNRWRLDAQRAYHRGLIEHSHRHCYASTFDYRETLALLEQTFKKRRSDFTICVASLGSKMQKVGQVLFHLLRPEASAVVSVPRKWDEDRFSSPARATYVLPLGAAGTLKESLLKTRRFRI